MITGPFELYQLPNAWGIRTVHPQGFRRHVKYTVATFPGRYGEDFANIALSAFNAALAPSHTDLMVSPELLDEWLEQNPLPQD